MRFIISGMYPFSMVEQNCFKDFTYGMQISHYDHAYIKYSMLNISFIDSGLLGYKDSNGPIQIPSRYKLTEGIMSLFENHKDKLIELLKECEYICETADIWSNKHRGFLGVTAHWLDSQTFQRRSIALSCSHFPSPHSHEKIAEKLQLLNAEYNIAPKIITTVTDNASNFVKAFDEFGQSWESIQTTDVQFHEFPESSLSRHHRCTTHTLALVAKDNALNALDNGFYNRLYHQAIGKLEKLWRDSGYQKANEICQKHLKSSIKKPNTTRWNSQYDAVKSILAKDKEGLQKAMRELKIDPLSSIDREFLEEYRNVFAPIAEFLDYCQQDNALFGLLLPGLFSLKKTYLMMDELKFCTPLVIALVDGIEDRFSQLLDFDSDLCVPALIAACSHPFFKLRWLEDEAAAIKAREYFVEMMRQTDTIENSSTTANDGNKYYTIHEDQMHTYA